MKKYKGFGTPNMEAVSGDVLSNNSEYCAFKSYFVIEELSNLLGQILTVIDASTTGEQNQAMKSLVREKFGTKQDYFSELGYKQVEEKGEGHGPRNHWEDALVPYNASVKNSFK